jgi:BirA family biotin operon repressor/biotin-[acetyl-CoA-carboxylase] ligase
LSADPLQGGTTDAWPAGYDRLVLPQVDSTNDEAARRFPGLTRPLWVLALHQTAARGRRGRAWAMPPGNFAATLAMPVDLPAADAALRSFVAALALADALSAVSGPARTTLKWPNDVLLNGGKVAGILLEAAGQGSRVSRLAIGIGVNLAAAPDASAVEPGALPPVSLKGETGKTPSPEAFLTPLATAFARWEAVLQAEGFAPIRAAFLSRAERLGEPITARTATEAIEGRFDTIDATGALVLTTAKGPRAVPAADVYFRPAG